MKMVGFDVSKGLFAGLGAGVIALSANFVQAATSVTIIDGGDTPRTLQNCGDLMELNTTPNNVTVKTTGQCSVSGTGGVDTPTAVYIDYGNVAESSTVTIDVNDYDIIVTNPSSVNVTSATSSEGGSITRTGSKIIWSVPEVTGGDKPATITYTIDDASDGTPSTSTISLNIQDGVTPPPSGSCVETGNIVCKGPVDWPAGTNFGPNIATSSDFEIWEFTYENKANGSFSFVNQAGGNPIYARTAIISETPDESMNNPVAGDARCKKTNWGSQTSFYFDTQATAAYYECPLVQNTKYYLKMQINDPNVSDGYYLTTY